MHVLQDSALLIFFKTKYIHYLKFGHRFHNLPFHLTKVYLYNFKFKTIKKTDTSNITKKRNMGMKIMKWKKSKF